jgi:hypothetical protein
MGTLITYPRSDGMTFSEGKALMTSEGEIVTHLSLEMGDSTASTRSSKRQQHATRNIIKQ